MTEIQQVGLPAPQDVRLQVDWRNFDFADRERLVSAIRNTEQVASLMATVRLYLLAGAMQSGYDWIAMREIVVEATGTSVADADEWILVASRLGYDLLRRAMEDVEREQGHVLSFAQWKAIAMAGDADQRRQLHEIAATHGVPAYEIEATVQGMTPDEYRVERLLKQLKVVLRRLDEMGARDRASEVLSELGYIQRRITNVR